MASVRSELQANPQLDLLSQMIEEISGELALEPLLQRIAERACRLTGADDSMIGLYDADRDAVRTAATYGKPMSAVLAYVPRGQGLAGRVLELDAAVRTRYGDLPTVLPTEVPDKMVIGMPIRIRNEIIGVFCLGASPPKRLGVNTQALLEQFARHAAVAIDNARRYTDEQDRADRFALIARVAAIMTAAPELDGLLERTADAIHSVLGYPNVDIPIIEPEDPGTLVIRARGGQYKRLITHVDRLPVGAGVMGAAAAERRTQRVNDVATDARYVVPPGVRAAGAELAIPIIYGSEVLGVLNVEGPRPFTDLDVVSLEVVAENLAIAIVNARLQDRARSLALLEERQRLARDLHDNVTQILSSISLITQSLPGAYERDPVEARRRAARLGELSQLAFTEMRALLVELSPSNTRAASSTPGRDASLAATLGRLLGALVPPQVQLHLDVEEGAPLPAAVEEAVLRIGQEAVSNAARHSGGERIVVIVRRMPHTVRLTVSDDGSGMPAQPRRGMGLDSMRDRARLLGGVLVIEPARERGTNVRVALPLGIQERKR